MLQFRTLPLGIIFAFFTWVAAMADELPTPAIDWQPQTYRCISTKSPIAIDGYLDEFSWLQAPWSSEFVDIEGGDKEAPALRTKMKMIWDMDYLYLGAVMEEPHVWGTLTERDSVIYHDDDFEVFIDPDGDSHLYYEIEINALGTVWDLLLVKPYRDGAPAINAWDIPGLKSAVNLGGTVNDPSDEDLGWCIELAIPWPVLKEAAGVECPPLPGDRWRMNFSRVDWQMEIVDGEYVKQENSLTKKPLPENNWVWSPQGLVAMHYPEMWGIVEFSDSISMGETVEIELSPEDLARWALYQAYYLEHNLAEGEEFTADPATFADIALPEGWEWSDSSIASRDTFMLVLDGPDGSSLAISEDGCVKSIDR